MLAQTQTVTNKKICLSKFKNYKTRKLKKYLKIRSSFKMIIINLKLKNRNLKMVRVKII